MATIYRKTAKGHHEIETRALRLSPRLRSALILVDGRRSDDELRKLILQEPEATLQALAEQGFAEVIGITQDVPRAMPAAPARAPATNGSPLPQAPVAAAPAAAPVSPQQFASARAQAVRAFTDAVGPIAEALAIKIERARTPEELRPLLRTAQTIIANSRGANAAADYGAKFLG